jgi:hypothetical protein
MGEIPPSDPARGEHRYTRKEHISRLICIDEPIDQVIGTHQTCGPCRASR